MAHVKSKDGTHIAFEKRGEGSVLIVVSGALSYRALYDKALVSGLAENFTLYTYDRRGRGESADTQPYNPEKEIEDIEALIENAGGSAYLYGVSSGAALSVLAASKLGKAKIARMVLYEPPYGSNTEKDKLDFAGQRKRTEELITKGARGDAATYFLTSIGMPKEALEGLRKSPQWQLMAGVEHTLAYDFAILNDGAIPKDAASKATTPTLVVYGEKSLDFMSEAAKKLSDALPDGQCKALKGQTHQPSPEIIVPLLREFLTTKQMQPG